MKWFRFILLLTLSVFPGVSGDKGLEKYARHWARELSLADWSISVIVAPRSAFRPGTCGSSFWDETTQTVAIFLLSEPDYVSELGVPYNQGRIEQRITIIHELVHLAIHTSVIEYPEDPKHAEERAVKRLTKALARKAGVSNRRNEDEY